MLTTLFLAKFWGLYMLIIGIAIFLRPANMAGWMEEYAKSPALAFTVGAFTLLLGIYMVLIHTILELWLPFFVTLFAWLTLIKGVVLITFPEWQMSIAKGIIANNTAMRAWSVMAIVLGGAMTWFGFAG